MEIPNCPMRTVRTNGRRRIRCFAARGKVKFASRPPITCNCFARSRRNRQHPVTIRGGNDMQRTLLLAGLCAAALIAQPVLAAPDMSLSRLDCGTPAAPTAVNQRFSDTYAYGDLKVQLIYSCYLVKHGDEYLLWDTGHAMTTPNVAPKVSLVDLLGQINLKPEQIKYVGISHYHGDHVGQVGSFPKSTLLIGK